MAKKSRQGMPTDETGKRIMLVRPRSSPTEELVASVDAAKRKRDGEVIPMDMSPALSPTEFNQLQTLAKECTPEQFQTALANVLQKMIVTGLKDMPAPKSIKELESLVRLFRQTSGLEAKDKAGGGPSGGFLPRVVTRRSVATEVEVIPPEPNIDLTTPEPNIDLTTPEPNIDLTTLEAESNPEPNSEPESPSFF